MKNIPTAEKLAIKILLKGSTEYSSFDRVTFTGKQLKELAIEFAKLHVEAAIKMCIEEAPSGSSTDTVSYEDVVEALTDCYPLDLIK